MPPHPTFYAKKIFSIVGLYDVRYKIAADFDLLLRVFLNKDINIHYFPCVLVKMLPGGISNRNILSTIALNKEILHSCKKNKLNTNYLLIYSKYLKKIFEFNFFNK